MDKYKNKYRIASSRAPFWDYGWNASYFVTICTKNREYFFGNVLDGTMELSEIGQIAESCWYEIPNHFPFVELGAHIIMPNHVHGIITINKSNDGRNDKRNDERNDERNDKRNVETQNFASLPLSSPPSSSSSSPSPLSELEKPKNQFGPQSKNLASIIRGFKIGVTKNARIINTEFGWQPRYHDHIIRNQKSFQNISNYIKNNPMNWNGDKFFNT